MPEVGLAEMTAVGGWLVMPEAGTTKRVTLWGGTEVLKLEPAKLTQLSQLGLEFRRNENSFGAKSHAMNAGFSKSGENGL